MNGESRTHEDPGPGTGLGVWNDFGRLREVAVGSMAGAVIPATPSVRGVEHPGADPRARGVTSTSSRRIPEAGRQGPSSSPLNCRRDAMTRRLPVGHQSFPPTRSGSSAGMNRDRGGPPGADVIQPLVCPEGRAAELPEPVGGALRCRPTPHQARQSAGNCRTRCHCHVAPTDENLDVNRRLTSR